MPSICIEGSASAAKFIDFVPDCVTSTTIFEALAANRSVRLLGTKRSSARRSSLAFLGDRTTSRIGLADSVQDGVVLRESGFATQINEAIVSSPARPVNRHVGPVSENGPRHGAGREPEDASSIGST